MKSVHVIAFAVNAASILAVIIFARARRHKALSLARAFGIAIALLAAPALTAAYFPPWDDESQRLMAVQSLYRDGDMNLANDYRDERWRFFKDATGSYFEEVAGSIRRVLDAEPSRSFLPYYGPAEAAVNAAGFSLGMLLGGGSRFLALVGVRLGVWLAAALAAALFYRLLLDRGSKPSDAMEISAALMLAPGWSFLAVRLWPEIYAFLILVAIVRLMSQAPSAGRVFALGALVAILPLFHARYVFLAAASACVLFAMLEDMKSRGLFIAGGVLPALGFAGFLALRNQPDTMHVFRAIGYPDPTVTGKEAFSLAYLSLAGAVQRVLLPPAGFPIYIPAICVAPFVRGMKRRENILFFSLLAVLSVQILTYAQTSGPVGRYWIAVVPLGLLALSGPRLERMRTPFRALAAYGAIRSVAFAACPVLAFDAKVAVQIAAPLPSALRAVVVALIG